MNTLYRNPRIPDFPAITLRKNGTISIHLLTVNQFGLVDTQFANLDFDPVEATLEIKPTAEKGESSLEVSRQGSGALLIPGGEFLTQSGISYSGGSRVLPVEWDSAKGNIVAKLN